MQYNLLPNTKIKISKICLGTISSSFLNYITIYNIDKNDTFSKLKALIQTNSNFNIINIHFMK